MVVSGASGRTSSSGGLARVRRYARSCGETRSAGVAGTAPKYVACNALPQNSSRWRRDLAGSGARAEARQVSAEDTRHSPGFDRGRNCGLPRLLRLPPVRASLFAATVKCSAGLRGYLLVLVVTAGSRPVRSGYCDSSAKAAGRTGANEYRRVRRCAPTPCNRR
jgi:hypothetical protein